MIKVGVIRGGVSPQYETSLATGGQVLSVLRTDEFKDKYKVFDMLLDKEGILHINGLPIGVEDIHSRVDVVFNALHGDFGADGKLQQILEHWNIPYTGSGIFPSAMSSNRKLAKYKFHSLGLNTPPYIIVSNYNPEYDGEESTYATRKAREVWNKMPAPWIVKPILMGSGVARHVCKTFPELVRAFEEAMRHGISVVVEELIEGRTASVSVINQFRNQDIYSLPAVETLKNTNICPAKFSSEEKIELERLARLIHKEFNLDHYSKSNFIVHPKKGVYVISIENLPALDAESHVDHMIRSVGANMKEFVDHIIQLALGKK